LPPDPTRFTASSPLGVFPGDSWSESRIQLNKEYLLFPYTDGINPRLPTITREVYALSLCGKMEPARGYAQEGGIKWGTYLIS
jgi:hypothetical protein